MEKTEEMANHLIALAESKPVAPVNQDLSVHLDWGPREEKKLAILDHFYRRMVNLSLGCDKDKKKLEKLLGEYQYALKNRGN